MLLSASFLEELEGHPDHTGQFCNLNGAVYFGEALLFDKGAQGGKKSGFPVVGAAQLREQPHPGLQDPGVQIPQSGQGIGGGPPP